MTAERHIPHCKNTINRPKPPPHIAKRIQAEKEKKEKERKERLKARRRMNETNGLPKRDEYEKMSDRAYQTSNQFSSPMKEIPEEATQPYSVKPRRVKQRMN